jgi:hypothetical protein
VHNTNLCLVLVLQDKVNKLAFFTSAARRGLGSLHRCGQADQLEQDLLCTTTSSLVTKVVTGLLSTLQTLAPPRQVQACSDLCNHFPECMLKKLFLLQPCSVHVVAACKRAPDWGLNVKDLPTAISVCPPVGLGMFCWFRIVTLTVITLRTLLPHPPVY